VKRSAPVVRPKHHSETLVRLTLPQPYWLTGKLLNLPIIGDGLPRTRFVLSAREHLGRDRNGHVGGLERARYDVIAVEKEDFAKRRTDDGARL
jgi:hypothetical protein